MAIDNSAKAAKFATDVVRATEKLLSAQEELTTLAASKTASGLNLAAHDFSATAATKHIDNAILLDGLNSVAAINGLLAQGHATNLNKIRP
ncbi:MAG: hypothetical protein V4671_15920 [Armatimonadota bacterium]